MCVRHQPESGFFSFQTKDNWFAEKYFPRILRVLNFPPEGPTRVAMENLQALLTTTKSHPTITALCRNCAPKLLGSRQKLRMNLERKSAHSLRMTAKATSSAVVFLYFFHNFFSRVRYELLSALLFGFWPWTVTAKNTILLFTPRQSSRDLSERIIPTAVGF